MTFLDHWLLTILLSIPAAGGLIVVLIRSVWAARHFATGIAIAVVFGWLLALIMLQHRHGSYDYAPTGSVEMLCSAEIVPAIHWSYRVAIDGLSLPFCVVTSLITLLACAITPHGRPRAQWFFAMILWLEALAIGVFVCFDLLLLWTFLALLLVPCCALLALDQNEHAGRAIVIFLICMLIGLACLFVGVLGVRIWSVRCLTGGTLDLVRLAAFGCAEPSLFLLMLVGFLSMVPVFPLHSWVAAIAQSSSPAALAMVVGVIPLIGGYGLLRAVIPLFPDVVTAMWWLPAALGSFMVLYCALCAIGTEDSCSAAVSLPLSMSGFALIGVATLTSIGLNGAVVIVVTQSLVAPYLIGTTSSLMRVADRGESRRGRVTSTVLTWLTELILPGVGLVMVILGLFQADRSEWSAARVAIAGVLCLGTVLDGVAGVRVLRRITKVEATATADFDSIPRHTPVVVAALVCALGMIPLCIACAGRGWMAMITRFH